LRGDFVQLVADIKTLIFLPYILFDTVLAHLEIEILLVTALTLTPILGIENEKGQLLEENAIFSL
jgi:hypothetical protein